MLDEYLKLSTKWRISGKLFQDRVNASQCVEKASWVFLALVTWLKIFFFFFFENLTEFDIMLVERPELSRKSQDSGKRL